MASSTVPASTLVDSKPLSPASFPGSVIKSKLKSPFIPEPVTAAVKATDGALDYEVQYRFGDGSEGDDEDLDCSHVCSLLRQDCQKMVRLMTMNIMTTMFSQEDKERGDEKNLNLETVPEAGCGKWLYISFVILILENLLAVGAGILLCVCKK